MRSGATSIGATLPPSPPRARSARPPLVAPTTAPSRWSRSTAALTTGHPLPPTRSGSSSPRTRVSITPLVRLSKICNMGSMPDTHVVTNQVPPLENHNPASSAVLVEALIREGGQWGLDEVTELGAINGSHEAQRWGELA